MAVKSKKRHDHRQSLWLIAGGTICWCYQCGAWRINAPNHIWNRPTGLYGINPAMKPSYIKRSKQ